ncbi:hypothetical protein [Halomarina litorea]|uniref:hypothetical protein n=1 Tax=Halomarina litorea TaxID=2961595 RepID=UPI0020C5A297|nr:hypothetical protein [Halomarina sp. BCD28]
MNDTERGRLSARVRVLEALEHLRQAREALAQGDDVADALGEAIREVEALRDGLEDTVAEAISTDVTEPVEGWGPAERTTPIDVLAGVDQRRN